MTHDRSQLAPLIFTRNGFPTENPFPGKKVLHIGCGHDKLPGAIGMDMLKLREVDVVHNLDVYPWPQADGSVDVIFGHSVLEHVGDVVSFMDEAWRILKPGGRLIVAVPYFRSTDSFTDITHKHFFTSQSLDYFFDEQTSKARFNYSAHLWKRVGFWYGRPAPSKSPFTQAFKDFIGRYPHWYDKTVSLLVPVKNLVWEMEPKK